MPAKESVLHSSNLQICQSSKVNQAERVLGHWSLVNSHSRKGNRRELVLAPSLTNDR
jgi:hypothetical protein